MATLKQTIANRLNSLKSTGPRSAAGRDRAARNATRHGLSRLGATPPAHLAGAIADRMAAWRGEYRPRGPAQEWHFERLCAESVRLDACECRIVAARAEAAERAAESWDDDRNAEVAALAARLPVQPEVIQPRLLQSRHGVLWLLERWGDVADSLSRAGGWSTENWFVALDLLGVPIEGRRHSGPWDVDPEDGTAAPGLELARQGVEALRGRLEGYLDARDARRREDAEAGLDPDGSPEIRRLERDAADARRQVARNRDELRRLQAEAARAPKPTPRPTPAGPPGPWQERSALRSRRPSAPASPPVTDPSPAPSTSPEPAPSPIPADPAESPAPSPSRPVIAGASLRDRFLDRTTPSNRRSRRAQAAASRRS